jgi:sugar phosphate isomerase/epimerase
MADWIQTGSSIIFLEYTLEQALEGLAAAGFVNVEIGAVKGFLEHLDPDDPDVDGCRRLLADNGLTCVSLSGHAPLHQEIGRTRLTNVLRAGKELGIRVLNTFTGDAETPEEIDAFKQHVREVADEARAAGIVLALETDSNLLPTAEIGQRILDEIGHDAVRINYDPGNVVYYTGADPSTDIEFALPRLGHVHLKDQRGGRGKADFPPLGEGDVDIPYILRRLAETGFDGPVSMEIEFTDYRWPPWDECVEAARRSKAYWDSLTAETGSAA